MGIFDALILGVLQGVTEFLPVSSSGHLVLGEHFLGLNASSLRSFDVMVHMGTLLAVFIYFWKDIWGMTKAFFTADFKSEDGKLAIWIVLATIPAVIVGLLWADLIDAKFRSVESVGWMMLAVGVIFFIGEWVAGKKTKKPLTLPKAIVVGLAQTIALIPGISRSGSTIVAGVFQGLERAAAARFSFLLGIPAMLGAGILTMFDGSLNVEFWPVMIGFLSSFAFGILTIYFLMKFLRRHSLRVFGVYLIVVGLALNFF